MASPQARTGTLEEGQVRAMFDRIAGVYDLMNSVMTAGLHHRWRERAADLAALAPGNRALDVAAGTGDLAIELARRVAPDGSVIGTDFSDQMLERARAKSDAVTGSGRTRSRSRTRTTASTPRPSASAPATSPTSTAGSRSWRAWCSPGGRVVILEITTPQKPPLSFFFSLWFDRIVPALGKLAGDPDAYAYLPSSVKRFPGPEALGGKLAAAGLTDVRWILTAGGIIAIHAGMVR